MGALWPATGRPWGVWQRFVAQVPRYMRQVRRDPGWLAMFALGRLAPLRQRVWRLFPAPATAPRPRSPFTPTADPDAVADALRRDGIWRGLLLPADLVAGMRAFAEATPCFGNLDQALEFLPGSHAAAERALGRPILVGHYLDRVEDCPEVRAVRADPLLRAIAGRYLRAEPVPLSCRLWWSFPSALPRDQAAMVRAAQDGFHFDLDDWRTLKFFFYLTDVDDGAGPHVYVRESHRLRALRHQFTLLKSRSDEDICAFYGPGKIERVHGPAGFGFAVDPFGYHTGAVATKTKLLMLDIEFGVSRRRMRRGAPRWW
jgi:hypothetical protein